MFNESWGFERCDGCGRCVEVCKKKCITKVKTEKGWGDGFNLYFNMKECDGCELCIKVCPWDALSIIDAPYQLSAMERLGMIG